MYTFAECTERIRQEINQFQIKNPKGLYEPIAYTFSTGGKYLRSSLTLMACNLFSNTIEQAIYPALGIEAFHNFTLIHDDIMDQALMRRGKPTVHIKWSENTALLSGDAMHVLACQYMLQTPKEVLLPVLKMFHKTAMEVCEGQQWDMDFEQEHYITIEDYLKMIDLKTSVLLAGAAYIGGLCGGGDTTQCDLLYQFGHNLGMAFQIQDDLLDVYSDPNIFGKAVGGDIQCNKKTFLLVTAINKADDDVRARLIQALTTYFPTPEEKIQEVIDIYNLLNIKEDSLAEIEKYFSLALQALHHLNVPQDRTLQIEQLALSLMHREK